MLLEDIEAQILHVLTVTTSTLKNVATLLPLLVKTKVLSVFLELTVQLTLNAQLANTTDLNAVSQKLVETKMLDVAEDEQDSEMTLNVIHVTMILMNVVPQWCVLVPPWESNVWTDTTTLDKLKLTAETTVPTTLNHVVPFSKRLAATKTSFVLMTKPTTFQEPFVTTV